MGEKKSHTVPEEGYFLYAKKETSQSPQIHNVPHPVRVFSSKFLSLRDHTQTRGSEAKGPSSSASLY